MQALLVVAACCLVLVFGARTHERPDANLKTISAIFLTRHGARSPYLSVPGLHLDEWDCSFSLFHYPGLAPTTNLVPFDGQMFRKNYIANAGPLPGNCSQGQLTTVGAQMLRDSGTWLRTELGDLLPAHWDPNTMYARSTDIDRTYESAENLLQALFEPLPLNDPDETNVANIWTVEKGFDMLDVAQNAKCPALLAACSAIADSSAWAEHQASIEPLLDQLAEAFNVSAANVPDVAGWLEVLRARQAQGLPLIIDQATYDAMIEAASWELRALYNNATVHKLTSGQLLGEIVDTFQAAEEGSGRIFTLLSAHDTTVAPLLSALSVNWTTWPEYAANVLLKLSVDQDSNLFVTAYSDRKPVALGPCGMQCPWDQFVAQLQPLILDAATRGALCEQGMPRGRRVRTTPEVGFLCG